VHSPGLLGTEKDDRIPMTRWGGKPVKRVFNAKLAKGETAEKKGKNALKRILSGGLITTNSCNHHCGG